jgi:hypothetical protein
VTLMDVSCFSGYTCSLRLFAKYMKGGELLNLGFTPDA